MIGLVALGLIVRLDPHHFHRALGRTGFPPDIPLVVFYVLCAVLGLLAFRRSWSLIPLLGLVSCCYLLTGMAVSNWKWFGIWLVIGLVCYFLYGRSHSKLATVGK